MTEVRIGLSDKQRLAFYSPATEILYGGAVGGGKSLLLRLSAIRWCENVSGIQVYLFRRTFPELRDNHLRGPFNFFMLLAGPLARGEVKYNAQNNEFIWAKTNSRIVLCHCQHEDDVTKYQGAEIHVLMMDELTLFTEYQYRFLRSRVRLAGIAVPAQYSGMLPRIECGSNPGNIGHAFVKRMWNPSDAKLQNKIWRAGKPDGGMLRQFIPAKLKDNEPLLKSDPEYESRLDGLGSTTLVQAMKDGNWDIFAGQFFEKWNIDIHVLPDDFEIMPHWPVFGGYDDGFTHPFVWGAYAVDGDGNCIKFAEAGDRGRETDQIADDIKDAYRRALGYQGSQTAKKIIDTLDKRLGNITNHAGHDIWAKPHLQMKAAGREKVEQLRSHGLNFIHANIDRKQGASWMRTLLDWRRDDSGVMVKKPKLYFKKSCWRSIRCIPQMQFDENDPEDVMKVDATESDIWAGDDAYDEPRYAAMSLWRPAKVEEKQADWGTMGWYLEQLERDGYDISGFKNER